MPVDREPGATDLLPRFRRHARHLIVQPFLVAAHERIRVAREHDERIGRRGDPGGARRDERLARLSDERRIPGPERLAHARGQRAGRIGKAGVQVGEDAPCILAASQVDHQQCQRRADRDRLDRQLVAIEGEERRGVTRLKVADRQ